MKAVILEKINEPLIVGHVTPMPLDFGQVLVKNIVSGLCGSQLLEIGGHKGNAKFVPHLLGHEGCGIVVSTGQGVTKVKPKDKVVMHWMKGDGIESSFPKYQYNGSEITSGKVTTLSEYSIVSENRLTPVDADTSPELCALLGCSLTTALGTITNEAKLKMGESILVLGCGGVGLNVILGAYLHNAYPIIAVDINVSKASLAFKMGARGFLHANKNFGTSIVKEKFDVIVDTTGNGELIEKTLPLLENSGRYILVGQSSYDTGFRVANFQHLFGGTGKTIKASQGGGTNPTSDILRYIKLAKYGMIDVNKIITHTLSLDRINDAVELLKQGNSGRIIIKI